MKRKLLYAIGVRDAADIACTYREFHLIWITLVASWLEDISHVDVTM